MQVMFESPVPGAAQWRPGVESRVGFALRRLRPRILRAVVRLSDVNGHRGGVDKRCSVAIDTDGHGRLVATGLGADWRDALDAALARAQRTLVRTLDRRQDHKRARRRDVGNSPPARATADDEPPINDEI